MMKLVNSWVNEMLRKAFISGAKVDDWLNKAKRGRNQVGEGTKSEGLCLSSPTTCDGEEKFRLYQVETRQDFLKISYKHQSRQR